MTKKSDAAARAGQQAEGPPPDESVVDSQTAPAAGPGGSGVPVEDPREAVRRLEDELAGLRDQHVRLAAEFDNYRKRVVRENQVLAERAQASLAINVLEVLDDLDRILAGIDDDTPADSLHQALVLVDRKLRKELEAAGLERLDPAGHRFDPSLHEAVATVPAEKPDQDHQVSTTFQAGYLFKGNLIRPARVQVYSDQDQA